MNPLTLDFIRRWKWLLVTQFVLTVLAWISHATQPKARLHVEVFVAVAMSWDLMRGLVRAQLGLPQRREAIAAGLWLSVVGMGAATHVAAMLLGGAVLAPLLGQEMNAGVLGLHFVISLILIGAVQFILTGLPSSPPRTLAARVKGTIFAGLWGLPMFGSFWIAFFAPADWREVTAVHGGIMVLLGVMAVASWFTTRAMMMERAMPSQEAAPQKRAADSGVFSAGAQGWRLRMKHEVLCLMPTIFGVLVASAVLISIDDFSKREAAIESREWIYQYRSLGMLCTISVFPVVQMAAASLRAFRGLPVPLPLFASMVAIRPFVAGVAVFFVYALLNWVLGRGTGMTGRALVAFLPLCSLTSLMQVIILRHPRLPVAFALLVAFSLVGSLVPGMMRLPIPSIWLLLLSVVILVISWRWHVRWLGNSSLIYRLNQGFLRMVGGAQR